MNFWPDQKRVLKQIRTTVQWKVDGRKGNKLKNKLAKKRDLWKNLGKKGWGGRGGKS